MSWYEQAATLRPPGNGDALPRWNTCARLIMSNAAGSVGIVLFQK
jgi:hypothetical protein